MLHCTHLILLYFYCVLVQSDNYNRSTYDFFEFPIFTKKTTTSYQLIPTWNRFDYKILEAMETTTSTSYTRSKCQCFGKIRTCYGADCPRQSTSDGSALFVLLVWFILCCICFGVLELKEDLSIQRNSSSNVLPRSTQRLEPPNNSRGLEPRQENDDLRNLNGNAPVSIEYLIPSYYNLIIHEVVTASVGESSTDQPPAYDAMPEHNAITMTIEQEPLSPPSYNNFIRGTYRKNENRQEVEA